MRFFEDLEVGETLSFGGLVVDADEAAEFARRYDPPYIPPTGVAYVHRGPRISPLQAAALGWKMLLDLAAEAGIEEAVFSRPGDLEWQWEVCVSDRLRIEVELVEILPGRATMRDHGLARVKVTMITTGPAGFGAWGDDDQELVDDVAMTYSAVLKARRREQLSIFHGIA